MIFFNKSKATWKKAHELRKNPSVIMLDKWKQWLKDAEAELKQRIDNDHKIHEIYAYGIASKNNFLGSPEFYWNLAQPLIDKQITLCEEIIDDYKMLIQGRRELLKTKIGKRLL
jgi:hypothetical protein